MRGWAKHGWVIVAWAALLAGCGEQTKLTSTSPEAVRLYGEGVALWEKFYFAEAKSSFDRALRMDSSFAMAWCRLAMVDAATENMVAAKLAMHHALALAPGATRREMLFISMWHRRLEFDNVGAAAAADSLLKFYPEEKEGYLFRGNIYEEMDRDFDAAVRYYQKAVDADSNYAQAVMSLGYAYSNLGDQLKAVELMQRYIRLAPEAADPRASYADLLVRAGRYDEALEQYQKSLELKPDYWYSLRQIGNVYALLGRLAEAGDMYAKSLSLLPAGTPIEASRLIADATLNMERNKFAEAAGQFRQALEIDSAGGSAGFGLVSALTKLKQFDDAWTGLERIKKELHKRNLTNSLAMLSYHVLRSRLLAEQNDLGNALAECDSALEYSLPLTRPTVYRQMAEIHMRRAELEDALDACEGALSVNPNFPDVLLTLTKVYHRKGDTRMTVEIGSRLLALWNKADADFANRNELLRILGTKPSP